MHLIHILAALCVALIWGTNFVAIKLSYESFTPFALLFVRFVLSAFPAIFFIPKTKASWKEITGIALFLWIGQFSFTFVGIYLGAPPGLASLILQAQTIFTVVLSVIILHHRLSKWEIIGITIAFFGILTIAYERFTGGSFLSLLTILPAAICVAISNIMFSKQKRHNEHPLSMVVWSSLIPIPVMGLLSFIFEGPRAIPDALTHLTLTSTCATLYTVYFSTLIATSIWAYLMKKYPPPYVVPFSLLIPVFGMGSSLLILGECYTLFSLVASAMILIGLAVNQLARRWIPKEPLRKVA